jgi:hypothetical protein
MPADGAAARPFPREDFGTSRFKGSFPKITPSRVREKGAYWPQHEMRG